MTKKIPKAFFLFLTAVLIVEILIATYGPVITSNIDYLIVKEQKRQTEQPGADFELIILGDSSANFAIDTPLLSRNTGLRCYNFATMANLTMAGNYFLLREYLKHNRPPRYLLIMAAADSWQRDSSITNVLSCLASSFTFLLPDIFLDKNMPGAERKTFLRLFVHNLLPSQRYRPEIKKAIDGRIVVSKQLRRHQDETIIRLLARENGNYSRFILNRLDRDQSKKMADLKADFIDQVSFMHLAKPGASRLNYRYLEKITGLVDPDQTTILLAMPPLFKSFYQRPEVKKYIASYGNFLRFQAARNPGMLILVETPYLMDLGKISHTVDHLNRAGAREFTEFLSKRVLILKRNLLK